MTETHNFVIPDNASKKVGMCCTDLQAAVDIISASASSVQCVAAKCMRKSPSQPVHSSSASQEIRSILWSRMFTVMFTRACHMPVSQMNPVCTLTSYFPHIYTTALHLHLGLPCSLIPSGFLLQKPNLHFPSLLHMPHAMPFHHPWFDHPNNI
jgi:hypothetical protein